jgi:hypothetical protein
MARVDWRVYAEPDVDPPACVCTTESDANTPASAVADPGANSPAPPAIVDPSADSLACAAAMPGVTTQSSSIPVHVPSPLFLLLYAPFLHYFQHNLNQDY